MVSVLVVLKWIYPIGSSCPKSGQEHNTLIVVLNGRNMSAISNQVISWKDLLAELILSLILFVPFILTKEYRRSEKTEVTASA